MERKLLSVLKISVFFGLGIFLIWWAIKGFSEEDKQEIWQALENAEYIWLGLSVAFAMASHISRAMRWQMLIEPIAPKPKFKNTLSAIMVGYLANLAIPRLGEVMRCGIINRYENIPIEKSFGTVITERIIDVISLLILVVIVALTQFNVVGTYFQDTINKIQDKIFASIGSLQFYLLVSVSLILISIIGIFAFRYLKQSQLFQKILKLINGLWEGIKSIQNIKSIPAFIFHSVFIWFMYFMMIYICFQTMDVTSQLGIMPGLTVLVFGSFAVIATQGGIGAYPLIVAGLLVLYGIDYKIAYTFGWVVWSAQTLLIIIAGFISLILLPIINKNERNSVNPRKNTELEST